LFRTTKQFVILSNAKDLFFDSRKTNTGFFADAQNDRNPNPGPTLRPGRFVILSNVKDLFLILVKPTPDSSLTLRMTGTQIQVLYFVEDNKTVCHPEERFLRRRI